MEEKPYTSPSHGIIDSSEKDNRQNLGCNDDSNISNKESHQNDIDSSSFSLHIAKKSSSLETYFAIICVIAGSGVLALPKAISKSGLFTIVLLVTNFVIAWYTGNLNIKCLYYDRPRRLDSLPSIGYEAFGIFGRTVVQFAHYAIILGGSCIYILTAGHNIHATIVDLSPNFEYSEKYFILGCGVFVMIIYCSAKTLKEAAWMSVLGALTTVVVVIIAVIASGIDINSILSKDGSLGVNLLKFEIWELPSTLATASFAYGGAVVFPHIELTMRNRKNWSKLLFFALLSVSFMYFLISLLGVITYGDKITDYIYDSFLSKALKILSRVFMTSHVLLAAPVYMCSFGIECENYFNITTEKLGQKKELLIRFAVRSVQILILTVIVMYIPRFDAFVNLIGALANGLIIFIVPIVCYYKLFGFRTFKLYMHAINIFILIIGIICVVFGTIKAIEKFTKKDAK